MDVGDLVMPSKLGWTRLWMREAVGKYPRPWVVSFVFKDTVSFRDNRNTLHEWSKINLQIESISLENE